VKTSLYSLIAFRLEAILGRTWARVMSDDKVIPKMRLSKEDIKLVALMAATVGIAVGVPRLPYNNIFMVFLGLWLDVLGLDLMLIQFIYVGKVGLRSPNPKRRRHAVKAAKLMVVIAYIITAIGIYGGGRILARYFVFQRAITSGLTKAPTIITPQEAILTLLLLILLPLPAYAVTREAEKAIRLGTEDVMSA
jgi:hypothetical protein